jgi:hypothetical protein
MAYSKAWICHYQHMTQVLTIGNFTTISLSKTRISFSILTRLKLRETIWCCKSAILRTSMSFKKTIRRNSKSKATLTISLIPLLITHRSQMNLLNKLGFLRKNLRWLIHPKRMTSIWSTRVKYTQECQESSSLLSICLRTTSSATQVEERGISEGAPMKLRRTSSVLTMAVTSSTVQKDH